MPALAITKESSYLIVNIYRRIEGLPFKTVIRVSQFKGDYDLKNLRGMQRQKKLYTRGLSLNYLKVLPEMGRIMLLFT